MKLIVGAGEQASPGLRRAAPPSGRGSPRHPLPGDPPPAPPPTPRRPHGPPPRRRRPPVRRASQAGATSGPGDRAGRAEPHDVLQGLQRPNRRLRPRHSPQVLHHRVRRQDLRHAHLPAAGGTRRRPRRGARGDPAAPPGPARVAPRHPPGPRPRAPGAPPSRRAPPAPRRPPQTSWFIKRAAGLESCAHSPGHETAGVITLKHVYEIARAKQPEFPKRFDLEGVVRTVIAQCRSMGVAVVADEREAEDKFPQCK